MKKFLSILLSLSLVISLAGCGAPPAGSESSDSNESTITESESSFEITSESTSQIESVDDSKTETAAKYPWGIEIAPMTIGQSYPYKTVCYQDDQQVTIGSVTLTDYFITKAADPDRVQRNIVLDFVFEDSNAYENGMRYGVIYSEMTATSYEEGDGSSIKVEHNGKEITIDIKKDVFTMGQWLDHKFVDRYELCLEMPTDYEEFALMVVDYSKSQYYESEKGQYLEGFRLDAITNPDTPWMIFDNSVPVGQGHLDYMPENGATEVKLHGWNPSQLLHSEETAVTFNLTTYNIKEDQSLQVDVYDGSLMGDVVTSGSMPLSIHEKLQHDFTITVDGSRFASDKAVFHPHIVNIDGTTENETFADIPFADGMGSVESKPESTTESESTNETESADPENAGTTLEIIGWDVDTLSKDDITDVVFDLAATETFFGDYIIATARVAGEDEVLDTHRIDLGDKHKTKTELQTGFSIDGTLVDADAVTFSFSLYTSDNEEIAASYCDIPFEGAANKGYEILHSESDPDKDIVVTIEGPVREEKNEYDLDVNIKDWDDGDKLWVLAHEPGAEEMLADIHCDIESEDNHFGLTIEEDDLKGNTIFFQVSIADSTGYIYWSEVRGIEF
ncbi:MAG: hypothetical protein IIV99_06050 [Oscillospiraceae bacterium]|nr:hypothetical protein [Oscillospiraceae bacterium]